MAPPANRRTGFSRRAQYRTFLGYVAGVLAALLGAALVVSAMCAGGPSGLRTAASDATAPAASLAAGVRNGLGRIGQMIAGYATWGAENAALRREVALARSKAAETAAIAEENHRLTALLHLAATAPTPVAAAWLIASSDASARRYATISAGAAQGVRAGMPVRSATGLVGRVVEVGQSTARVLLVLDAESTIPAQRARDGLPMLVLGRGDGELQVRLLNLAENPLRPGDAIVASGSGGVFWPATPIAVVTRVTRDGATAAVLSDPAASEAVIVQPAWNPVADASLPPAPPTTAPPPARLAKKPAKPHAAKPHHHWL